MCKTVEKIEELNIIAKRMAYDLGYSSGDKRYLDNPWSFGSIYGSLWEHGRSDAAEGLKKLTSDWRP